MVHGRMKSKQKEENMQRFVKGETQIMVSTTVIEVGVNVPNASVMVIESAEKFGLSQFKLANILTDRLLLDKAKELTEKLLENDPDLILPEQAGLKKFLQYGQGKNPWSKIS
jgi:RecG-like helicase